MTDTVMTPLSIGVIAVATWFCRSAAFIVFGGKKEIPKAVIYLGKVLPGAVFGLLVIYSLHSVSLFYGSHGIPEIAAVLAVILLQLWKRQMLLSIAGGTILYMVLVQMVF